MTAPIPDEIRSQVVIDYQNGMSQLEVAAKHSIGGSTVHRILKSAGAVRGRKFAAHIIDEAVQDYLDSGDSARTVSKRHSMSEDTLLKELRDRELTRPSGATISSRTKEAVIDDFLDGMTIARIAAKHGLARSTIAAWLKADGITADDREGRGDSPAVYNSGWVRDGLIWRPTKAIRRNEAA